MSFNKNSVFISHSSKNKEIAEQLSAYLERLGVPANRIFCSSIISQGVNNGEKLGSAISNAIAKSKVLVFLLSNDFIQSTYCMQELGVGWHLSENSQAKCFCLILPDITLAEVKGFINSTIFKFTFIDEEHRNELSLFAENICKALHRNQPNHSMQTNYECIFYSAIGSMLIALKEEKKNKEEEENNRKNRVKNLEEKLSERDKTVERLNKTIKSKEAQQKENLLYCELQTIEERFKFLGYGDGISREVYASISKQFWFEMVNRYEELLDVLHIQPRDESVELLVACIYAAENIEEKAYIHFKNHVKLIETYLSYYDFSNFLAGYTGSMKDVIEILEIKIMQEKEGIVKDSYISAKQKLEAREATLQGADNS